MHTIEDKKTWTLLHTQLGRMRASRIHQDGPMQFAYDVLDVSCADDCDDHIIRIYVQSNVNQLIKTVKQVVGAHIL